MRGELPAEVPGNGAVERASRRLCGAVAGKGQGVLGPQAAGLGQGPGGRAAVKDYVYRPWTPGYRVYRGYIIGERNSCFYRVRKADVELPVPAAETVGVALVAEGVTHEKHDEA